MEESDDMTGPDRRPSETAAGHGTAGAHDEVAHIELSDEDITDAMKHIEGYLDITTEDFKEVYALAHRHAEDRLLGALRAERLMHSGVAPLAPGMMLDEAARALVQSGFKALPVVDDDGRVIGMLTETDFLRRLKASTFLDLLLKMIDDSCEISHRCHETPVREAMTAPAITVRPQAGFREMMAAFRRHTGRSMPVAGEDGRLHGLLLRKDFLEALDRGAHR
jgi:CBS-domain-containing membrane protein